MGKHARIRVSGPRDASQRDFAASLWGLQSAYDWVVSKCASMSRSLLRVEVSKTREQRSPDLGKTRVVD